MAKDSIFIDTKQIDRLAIELKGFEEEVSEATYHALNRTLDQVITHVGRIVPKEYAVKASKVKQSFRNGIKKPNKNNLEASLISRGHTLSLAHFPFSPKKPITKIKQSIFEKTVSATIKKSNPNVVLKQGFVKHTGAKSEDKIQYNVWKRLGKDRFPIAPIRTLSIPQMIGNDKISENIQIFANNKLAERLEHEIVYRMTSIGKKIKR